MSAITKQCFFFKNASTAFKNFSFSKFLETLMSDLIVEIFSLNLTADAA